MKNKHPTDQTINIDYCICPYCDHEFDGAKAVNSNLDERIIKCPKCKKDMEVHMSVEYTCIATEDKIIRSHDEEYADRLRFQAEDERIDRLIRKGRL